jgi:hypothetical protein
MIRMVPGQRITFSESIGGEPSRRPGDIPIERMAEIGPRIASLRAVPAELQVRPGDSLDLRQAVRVVALDSGGQALGTLPVSDRAIRPANGAANFSMPHRILGVREGEAQLTLSVPHAFWKDRTDARPSVSVPVRVSPSAPVTVALLGSPDVRMSNRRDDGMGGCQLDPVRLRRPREMPQHEFNCAQVFASEQRGPDQRFWLRAIVLTRVERVAPISEPPTRQFDRSFARQMLDSVLQLQQDAEDRGRRVLTGATMSGVSFPSYEVSRDHDTLFVLGRTMVIPSDDSTLVVMVDRDNAGRSNVATATIRAELPQDYWPKSWRNGDTTFFVRPSRAGVHLRDALRAVPGIELFLP